MGMKDTGTGKTVQLVFILSFGNLLIQEYKNEVLIDERYGMWKI
jgi:hypothetical protein